MPMAQCVYSLKNILFCTDVSCFHVSSTWVMVNLQKRKVAKIPDEMRQKLARFAPDPVRYLLSLQSTEISAFAAATILVMLRHM